MTRLKIGFATTLATLTLLTACRSTPSEFAGTPATTDSSSGVSSSTSPASNGASSSIPALPPTPAAALLTAKDLPTGFAVTTAAGALALGQAGCLTAASGRSATKSSAYVAFASAGTLPIFAESLAYVGAARSAAIYAAGVKILDACKSVKFTSGTSTFEAPMHAVAAKVVGARSKTYTLTLTSGTKVLTEDILISEEPGVVMMTSLAALSTPKLDDFVELSAAASAKL